MNPVFMQEERELRAEPSLSQKVGAFLFALCGVFTLGIAVVHVAKPLFASGPSSNRVLNYQIRLTDAGGIPLEGTQNVKLSFYTVPSGGTPVHTDCGTTGTPVARKIVVAGGAGSVLIGDTAAPGSTNCADASQPNALPANLFNNTSLYLGVTVGADAEMTPRKRIVAQGYALNADMLDDLDTSAIGGSVAFVPVTDPSGNLVLTQNLTVDGSTLFVDATNNRVGLGIGGPDSQLDVGGAYSAGAGVDYFVVDVNPTVGAGANDQVVSLLRLRHRGTAGAFTNVRMPLLMSENVGGGQHKVQLFETGLRIGNYTGGTASVANPSANLELDGFGSSSATFSMQAENLAGADVFSIRDDGRVGVRTFAPGATLDVHGGILANGDQIVDTGGDVLTAVDEIRTVIAEGAALVSAASAGLCTNSLTFPYVVYKDGNGDCISGNGGTDVQLLAGTADLASATVAVTAAWAFNDADTDCNGDGTGGDVSCTAADGIYQVGQDLYIDADPSLVYTSSRVGIGTTNPGAMLDVVGRGDGYYGGYPALAHLKTANSNTWNFVLSNQRAGGEANIMGLYMSDPVANFDYSGVMFIASYADSGNTIVDPVMTMMPGSGSVGIGQYYDYPTKFTVYAEPQYANVGGTTTANASTSITGVGTKFSTRIGLGDRISLSSAPTVFATVTGIASDTSLTVDRPLGNGTSQTINVRQGVMRLVTADDGLTRMLMNDAGNVLLGSTLVQPVTKLDLFGNTRLTGKATSVLSGSIDPAASTTVTGVGTAFLRELVVGDRITVTGETRTVTAIASDTSLTVDAAFSDNANDTSPDALYAIATMRDSASAPQLVVNNLGNVGIGTAAPATKLVVSGHARVGESATTFNDFGLPFQFVVNAERTDTSGTPYGTYSRLALNPASASTAQPIALSALLEINGTNSTGSSTGLNAAAQKYGSGAATAMRSLNVFTYNSAGNVTDMHAIRSLNQTQGGTITNAYGLQYQLFQNGGATTNAYGLKVESPSMGGGTITNLYGLHIDPQTAGGTSNFALLYNGSSPFAVTGAGSVGVGTSNPASFKLQVDGHVGPNLDDTYDLGSNALRWRDLYLGPASLHIGAAGNEAVIRYDMTSSKLSIDKPVDFTSTAGLSLDQGGVVTPTGGFGTYVNHLLYSEQFNQSTWVKTGVTVTADDASGPDAQQTADLINAGGAATDGVRRTVSSPPMLVAFGNRTWTGSVWLKAVAGTPSVTLVLDASTVSEPSTSTVTLSTTWKRYSITHTFTTGTGAPVFEIRNGTNAVHAWGAQLEYASAPGVYARTEASLIASTAAGTPNAGLVGNGSLLFSGSTGTTPMYGSGTRMMWIPSKSAFRAGYAANNWDDGFIGTYSAAFGHDTRASGSYSFAGGNQSTATSTNSFAFGAASVSSNFATVAMGSNAQATGSSAVAMGANAFASGGGALAIGNDISSSGVASAVIGNYVNASANYATVIGHGVDSANRIINNTADSLMIGFNSTVPTFFVGPSAGVGTTGNVGIGTASPNVPLTVGTASLFSPLTDVLASVSRNGAGQNAFFLASTDTSGEDAGIIIGTRQIGEDGAIFMDQSDARKLKFAMGTTGDDSGRTTNTRMTIDQSGNVGIADTTPTEARLVVESTSNAGYFHSTDTAGTAQTLTVSSAGTGFGLPVLSMKKGASIVGELIGYDSTNFGLVNGINLSSMSGRDIGFRINGTTEAARITTGGFMGIGTNNPGSRLDVRGSNTTEWIRVRSNASGTAGSFDMYSSGTGGFMPGTTGFNTPDGGAILFNVTSVERMRVHTNGNVGINSASPLARLDVAGNLRTTGKATAVLTGTIDPAASTTVTGVGTLFTSQLIVGDRITVTGQTRTVTAIATDTSLTVDTAFSDNANDTSPDVLYAIATMRDSSNAVKLAVNDLGNVGIGEVAPAFNLDVNGTSGVRVTGPSMYGLMLKSSHATSDFMGIRWRDNANANLWSMGNDFNGNGGHDFWLYDNVNSRTVLLADQAATSYLSFGTTNGGVEYDNATQQLRLFANGSNKLFVNSSGSVGIGVSTAPFGKLQVDASAAGTMAENLWLKNSAAATVDSSANIVFAAASGAGSTTRYAEIRGVATDVSVNPDGALAFVTMKDGAIAERMRVDADGRVGINVVPTSNTLQVENVVSNGNVPILSKYLTSNTTGPFSGLAVLAETSGDMADTFGATVEYRIDDATSAVQTIGRAGFVRDGNDGLGRFTVNPFDSGSPRNDAFNVQWGDATGPEVGIGTIDPATALHVVVSDSIGTVPPILRLQNTTDHPAADVGIRLNSFNQDFAMGIDETDDSFRIVDGTDLAGTARMIIDADGLVGIGATPVAKLHVSSSYTTGTASQDGQLLQIDSNRSGVAEIRGLEIDASELNASNTGHVYGLDLAVTQMGTAANSVRGIDIDASAGGSNNTVTLYGVKVSDASSSGSSQGDHYGVRLDVTTGTAGVHYGLYSNVSGGTNAYPGIFMGGNVGIGLATPAANLEVRSSTSAIRASYDADTYLDIDPFVGSNGVSIVFADAGANQANLYYNIANDVLLVNSTGNSSTAINTNAGNVGVGDISPDFKFDVDAASATVAGFNRTTDDGTIISLMQDGVEEGTISVSGTTVSYNAFTGSHYAWTDTPPEKGMLVTLTGDNRRLHGRILGEMLYGIAPTSQENDAKVLGAYLALQEPSKPADDSNPHLVMAVGNGEVWVVDGGQDIAIGDYLIASATPGHAVKDPATADVSHVVARAAEPVDWEEVADLTVDGKKHKLVSVTFESFSSRNVQPGVFGAKLSELTVDVGLDMRGYAIWGISSLRGLDDIWSIDDTGRLVVKEVVVDQVAIRQTDAKTTLDASKIPTGQDYAQVHNAAINAQTRVFVTFRKNPGSAWWVDEVMDGLFVVKTAQPVTEDVAFDYWLVQTLDERTPPVTVELPPAPEPEPTPEPIPAEDPPTEPAPEPAPEPVPDPEPAPAPAPEPEPVPEPAP